MAGNNYFNFQHGGTQYGYKYAIAQPAGAYPTAQTAYVQPTAQATAYAPAAARPAQTYEAYQAAQTTRQYYTATRPQVASAAVPTAVPVVAAAQAAPTAVYTVAEAPYQAAKPAYTAPAGYATTQQVRQPAAVQKQPVSTANFAYTSTTNPVGQTSYNTTTASTTYSGNTQQHQQLTNDPGWQANLGYDAALYSAATSYYQQQQKQTTIGTTVGANTWQNKKPGISTTTTWQTKKPIKPPPKPTQLHYCDVCKISCAGPQTYREHLEGQKHKKKEAAAKATSNPSGRGGQNQLRCELCDVACTGADAYAAHIRGAKHQKVLKLHTRLGKPIPSTEPVVVTASSTTVTTSKPSTPVGVKTTSVTKPAVVTVTNQVQKKIISTPKITFVGGTQLKTTGARAEEIKTESAKTEVSSTATAEEKEDSKLLLPGEKDVQPVGHEYIEEMMNEQGKMISFNCKLCECKFNDPNAKDMHMKGRRHRLMYKKKVDPSLVVEVKPSIRARKIQEEKMRRQAQKEEYWRRKDMEERWRMEEEAYWAGEMGYYGYGNRPPMSRGMPPFGQGPMGNMPVRRPDTSDDKHVMAKHNSIYPNEAELQAVQNIVSSCEKALKLVSDFIAESLTGTKSAWFCSETPKVMEMETKKDTAKKEEDKKDSEKKEESDKKEDAAPRALKGVMRVGVLAKGLLLHGDLNVHLVVLCSEKPTRTLLERVADNLPKQLNSVTEDKYEVKMCVEEAAVIVAGDKDPKTTCTITLTSPIMRDENLPDGEAVSAKDPPDVLDRQKCLDALAALRHAKWFQARANGLQSCVVVIRILRDLCQRVPTWTPLNQWAMELLVEKCVSSGGTSMNPGDALRRVFECIASGILLPGGPGLYDPCEKEPTDAASSLTAQEREDITASAQHALRLIAFRQIHKVLGMDALPVQKFPRGARFNPRKRRRTNSTGENTEEGGEKKDKKEDDKMEASATEGAQS